MAANGSATGPPLYEHCSACNARLDNTSFLQPGCNHPHSFHRRCLRERLLSLSGLPTAPPREREEGSYFANLIRGGTSGANGQSQLLACPACQPTATRPTPRVLAAEVVAMHDGAHCNGWRASRAPGARHMTVACAGGAVAHSAPPPPDNVAAWHAAAASWHVRPQTARARASSLDLAREHAH